MTFENRRRRPAAGRRRGHLSRADMDRLLASFPRTAVGTRNRALVVLMYRAGLRVSEACNLELTDLYPDEQKLHVRHGKGDKERWVGMDRGGWAVLDDWLAARPTGTPWVFPTRDGNPVQPRYVGAMLKRHSAKARIPEGRLHPHALRHAFAVAASRDGVPIRDIQRLLGHASLTYTAIYLNRLDPNESIRAVASREWEAPPIDDKKERERK